MKARDIARMEAGTRTFSFNTDVENSVKLATMEDYPAVALGISDTLKEIKSAHSAQSKDISGIAPTKQELRVEMGETILIYSQRGMVSATLTGNKELSDEIDHSLLYYAKSAEIDHLCPFQIDHRK